MKTKTWTKPGQAILLCALFVCCSVRAQEDKPIDRVLLKEGKMLVVQGGETLPMDTAVMLPNGIKVMTNGTFTVNKGKERALKEGQILGADGMLLSPDGSLIPVFDNITMKAGRPLITKDGDTTPLPSDLALPNGQTFTSDGYVVKPGGLKIRLLDGQIYKLDGGAVPVKDTILFKDGKVIVQKDGSLLPVAPGRSLMMNDGTKVFGDGRVVMPDGTERKLAEGELLTVEGVIRRN